MPTFTPNINLKKPLQSENYNVDVFNENCDLIDAKVGSIISDKSDKLIEGTNISLISDPILKTITVNVSGKVASSQQADNSITILNKTIGTGINNIPLLVDVGDNKVGLPAISGKLLTDINSINVGTILPFLATKAQAGWLAIDTGALVSRATYPELWAWVQTDGPLISETAWQAQAMAQTSVGFYSSGDGSTTFRLPRIVDFVSGTDVGRGAGTWRADDIKKHHHYLGYTYGSTSDVNIVNGVTSMGGGGKVNDTQSIADFGGVETRPKSISMLYCVKAFDATTNQGMIDITALANEMANKVNSSEFLGTNQSKTTNGWQKLPGGLILQWGYVPQSSSSGDTSVDVIFPISFPNGVFNATANVDYPGVTPNTGIYLYTNVTSKSGMTIKIDRDATSSVTFGIYYFVIGY